MAGLDPYEERLLIALLGGGIALIFGLVLVVICCRKYRLDSSGGGKERKWNQPQLMFQHPGRPQYFPTGHQMGANMSMDPAYLDPARAGYLQPPAAVAAPNLNPTYASAGPQHMKLQQQQQQQRQQRMTGNVDNTAYASVPYGRPQTAVSYSSHQV